MPTAATEQDVICSVAASSVQTRVSVLPLPARAAQTVPSAGVLRVVTVSAPSRWEAETIVSPGIGSMISASAAAVKRSWKAAESA